MVMRVWSDSFRRARPADKPTIPAPTINTSQLTSPISRSQKASSIRFIFVTMQKFRAIIRIAAACTFLIVGALWGTSWGQDDQLIVFGTLKDEGSGKKMPGVEVVVYQDGVEFDRLTTNARAEYDFSFPLRHDYTFSFEFPGYGNKRIQVDASGVPPEDLKGGFKLDLDMTLFELVDGFDTSILEDPYGKASFDPVKNTVAFDFDYTNRMKNRVEAEFERVENMAELLAQMREDFADLMSDGETYMGRQQWERALGAFTEALEIFPDDATAQQKQAEAQAKFDEARAAELLQEEFDNLIKSGNNALRADDYRTARAAFEEAAELKPNAPEPAEGLARVEAAEAQRAADAEYQSLIDDADAAFDRQDYETAIERYAEASDRQPSDSYPKQRKAEAQGLLDAAAADAAALAEKAERYEELIGLADKNFKKGNYSDAVRQYNDAAAILPAEQYPVDQAAEAQRRLDEDQAREAALAANEAEAAEEAALNEAFEAKVKAGDEAFDAENFTAAQDAYNEALALKPGERYPAARLERIQRELDRLAAKADDAEKDRAAAEAAAEAERLAEANRQAAAAQADQAEAERNRRLAEEAAAAEAAAAERARAEDEKRNRAEQLVAARSRDESDEAEAYYREALKSEERARLLAVEREKEAASTLRAEREQDAQERIESDLAAARMLEEHLKTIENSGESYQGNRRSALERTQSRNERQMSNYVARGDASIQDGQLTVQQQQREIEGLYSDHSRDYTIHVPEVNRAHREYRELNADLERSAAERRSIAGETATEQVQQMGRYGEGADEATQARYDALQAADASQRSALSGRGLDASIRSYDERRERLALDAGSPPDPDELLLSPEDAEVLQGVQEQSYDIPNGLVIERTVRRGNEVRRFRKVVTKTGVYYFEGEFSITADAWKRETTVVFD